MGWSATIWVGVAPFGLQWHHSGWSSTIWVGGAPVGLEFGVEVATTSTLMPHHVDLELTVGPGIVVTKLALVGSDICKE